MFWYLKKEDKNIIFFYYLLSSFEYDGIFNSDFRYEEVKEVQISVLIITCILK